MSQTDQVNEVNIGEELRKAEVERLLADYDADPITALTAALRIALAMPDATWETLLECAPIASERREQLRLGDQRALDELTAELNENRCLDGPE